MSDDFKPRLANFGGCNILGDGDDSDQIDPEPSPTYSSPEANLIEGQEPDRSKPEDIEASPKVTKEDDICAFGLVGAEVRSPSHLTQGAAWSS